MWSYAVKFLGGYGYGKGSAVPIAALRPGVYATEVNILNCQNEDQDVRKLFYLLAKGDELLGREPKTSCCRHIPRPLTIAPIFMNYLRCR
jgi:hypothetical protein